MAKRVCIVGAGPSGLVAAKTLRQACFAVTVYEARSRIGGLWPSRKDDVGADHTHPLMTANQSKHTMQFSDLAWEASDPQFPQAWMVGRYLERYAHHHSIDVRLRHRVWRAELLDGGWSITTRSEDGGKDETSTFDYLVVAAGFFGRPAVDPSLKPASLPFVHSLEYRDLGTLLGKQAGEGKGGKILVVGGQMSGVEMASTIASQISSLTHSPGPSPVASPEKYTVHHVVQRPIWVFPLFTSPRAAELAAPFVPLDLPSYNLSNREPPLSNTQGHISEDSARSTHAIFQATLGTDQGEFHPLLRVDADTQAWPAYLAVSDHYLDLVRSKLITLSAGKVKTTGPVTTLSNGEKVEDVAAVVFATGFEASSMLSFLPHGVLKTLKHSPSDADMPIALSFHGTHHPDLPFLGFVGFYRSPYWGVMEMQARFLASLWSNTPPCVVETGIDQTLSLRGDPRASQFPMGDYAWLMQELGIALGISISPPNQPPTPPLPHNGKPMDILTPARYVSSQADLGAREEATKARQQTQDTAIAGLSSSKFVARAIFRSLLGEWQLERDITSRSPYQPSGHFSGTARFFLRKGTSDGLQCVAGDGAVSDADSDLEYLYVEEGSFVADNGLRFTASRRYVWRYDERRDVLSVWFVQPNDSRRVDYLFHELKFPEAGDKDRGWLATAGHLCEEDYYGVEYEFRFLAVNLSRWTIEYSVKGPKKDYTLHGVYTR